MNETHTLTHSAPTNGSLTLAVSGKIKDKLIPAGVAKEVFILASLFFLSASDVKRIAPRGDKVTCKCADTRYAYTHTYAFACAHKHTYTVTRLCKK